MDNNKYLNKVIGSLVRGTKIDYDREEIHFPSSPPSSNLSFSLFYTYCKNMFGLTDDEIEYVWNEYSEIILDKISNKES